MMMNTTGQLTSQVSSLLSEGVSYAQTLPGGFRTSILTGLERTRTMLGTPTPNPKSAPLLYAAASRQLREVEQQVSQAIESVSDNQHGELTPLFQVQAICRLSLNELAARRLRRLSA
jgi:hypothetical protein